MMGLQIRRSQDVFRCWKFISTWYRLNRGVRRARESLPARAYLGARVKQPQHVCPALPEAKRREAGSGLSKLLIINVVKFLICV